MKTLTDLKRAITVGTVLRCIKNTKRPVLDNTLRTVTKVQTNGFYWAQDGQAERFWTPYPKASGFVPVSANSFRLALDEKTCVELEILG